MEFCKKLGIKDLNLMLCESGANVGTPYYLSELTNNLDKESVLKKPNCKNSDEIDIGAEDEVFLNLLMGEKLYLKKKIKFTLSEVWEGQQKNKL